MNMTTLPRPITQDRLNELMNCCRRIAIEASRTWPSKDVAADILMNVQSCPLTAEWRSVTIIKLDSCLPGDFIAQVAGILGESKFDHFTNGYANTTVLYIYESIQEKADEQPTGN